MHSECVHFCVNCQQGLMRVCVCEREQLGSLKQIKNKIKISETARHAFNSNTGGRGRWIDHDSSTKLSSILLSFKFLYLR